MYFLFTACELSSEGLELSEVRHALLCNATLNQPQIPMPQSPSSSYGLGLRVSKAKLVVEKR